MKNISKSFPGVQALKGVNLVLREGEIHAICGENGAGKSTLIKILGGVHHYGTYEGDVRIYGEEQQFGNVKDAEAKGIICIQQELQLVPEMSVTENIFLGSQITAFGVVRWNEMFRRTQEVLQKVGLGSVSADGTYEGISPDEKVKNLGVGRQQLVEIGKALWKKAKILILDEPTSALTDSEIAILFRILRQLKAEGVGIIYISHKIDEVKELADTVSVIRDGEYIGTRDMAGVTKDDIIQMMVGRELQNLFPRSEHELKDVGFAVRDYTVMSPSVAGKKVVANVSFEARRGELLGIAGLMGAGRTELVSSIFGAYAGQASGEIFVDGEKVTIRSPGDAIEHGIVLVPEDRGTAGLVAGMDVKQNITLSSLEKMLKSKVVLDGEKEIHDSNRYVSYLQIKTPGLEQIVNNLSGGNKQKVVIAKALLTEPKVLFLDEPTRGIDVGTKAEIFKIMHSLVDSGVVVIMVSSELQEILGVCDRTLVMSEGRLVGDFMVNEVDQEEMMNAMQRFKPGVE